MDVRTNKKIIIITTGGTIATRPGALMVKGKALITALPQLLDYATIEVVEFSNKGSSKMVPDDWLKLAQKVNEIFANDGTLSGIVITHGTDSMEETAFFLDLTVGDRRPVVLTGSMRTYDEVSYDGPANLINAVRVATHDQARAYGVLVVLNENIYSARDVWKTNNRNVATFQVTGGGYLGVADPDQVVFFGNVNPASGLLRDFNLGGLDKLPNVDILSDFTGFDPDILTYFGTRNIDGLVFQSFAGGRLSAGAKKGLSQFLQKKPVVIASKVPMGRIVGNPNPDLNLIYTRDLPANKARILLMLALTKAGTRRSIRDAVELF